MIMIRILPLNSVRTLVALIVVVISVLIVFGRRRRNIRGHRLPPGPTPLPLVGNLFSIDAKRPWLTYAEWATRYGDIFMVRVLKQDIVVINSRKIAKDLLERRSSIYSDRPFLATLEPFGLSFNFGWAPYGDRWRSQRRIFHQAFGAEAVPAFHPVQLTKAHQLVSDILRTPDDFFKHLQRFSVAVIMSIVYDYEVAPEHDYLVELFERGNALALESLTPESSSIVDAFPFVLSLPEWFPGATIKRKAVVSKRCATEMVAAPFEHARKREAMGSTASAVALDLLRDNKDDDPVRLQLLKETCATALVAGAESSTSTLKWFMLAMLWHPHVQERAHAEIDAVVGRERLPNFGDRQNLPYIEAVLLETLRMYPVGPLGIPHATTVDDIYENLLIPKGSTVVINTWAICHSEDTYPEPHIFKPDRFFINGRFTGEISTDNVVFGFGRRICPGRYTADATLWAAMVSILSMFKITAARDEQGEVLEFKPTFSHGVTTAPDPFPCAIQLRSSDIDVGALLAADPLH